jgi:hypothetical protein
MVILDIHICREEGSFQRTEDVWSGGSLLRTYAAQLPGLDPKGVAKRVHQLREEVCPEIARTSAFGVSLACSIGKLYDFAVYRVVEGFFPGGIRLKMGFGVCIEPS